MLNNIFTSDMLLQRDRTFCINGTANPGETVTGCLYSKTHNFNACAVCSDDGRFSLLFPPVSGGQTKYLLSVAASSFTQTLDNILFGDVFLLAGQSNMKYSVANMENSREILKTNSGKIRFLLIPDEKNTDGQVTRSSTKLTEIKQCGKETVKWQTVKNKTALKAMSGLGIMFGFEYSQKTGIPVGLIDVSVGGTTIDAHLSKEVIESDPLILDNLKERGFYLGEDQYNDPKNKRSHSQMCGIYNEKIAPLKPFKFKAVLWYQGEGDCQSYENTLYYRTALKSLIASYRTHFDNSELTFCLFHLALMNYHSHKFAVNLLNESIDTLKEEPGIFIVPQYNIMPRWLDKHNPNSANIHPINKKHLALLAANILYSNLETPDGFKAAYLKSFDFVKDKCVLRFGNVCGGLTACGNEKLKGFEACGENGIYFAADAVITAPDEITVSGKNNQSLISVSYAFFPYNYKCNVVNGKNIALLPFRTDNTVNPATERRYPFPQFMYCEGTDGVTAAFQPDFGGIFARPVWRQGEWFYTKRLKLKTAYSKTLKRRCLRLEYRRDQKNNFCFSVSPLLTVPMENLSLENYSALEITLESSSEYVNFNGIHFMTAESIPYMFRAAHEGKPFVPLKKGIQTIFLPLTELYRPSGKAECPAAVRKDVRTLQFTFYSKKTCRISLYSIRLIP